MLTSRCVWNNGLVFRLWVVPMIIFIMISPLFIFAQKTCQTDLQYHSIIQNNLDILALISNQETQLSQLQNDILTKRSIIVLPIVIHIIYHESKDSIDHHLIYEQLAQLNRDFNALNENLVTVPSLFRNDIGEVEIRFCISMVNENGENEIGIEQKTINENYFGDQKDDIGNRKIKYTILDGYDVWNSQKYINIWVADFENMAGMASFPGMENELNDGIMIDFDHFGGNNRTLTHEMGHFLNLKHLWGNEENCSEDDLVTDTPNQSFAHFDCPSHPQISCGSADMFMNFMDFTDDNCIAFFTKGQKERMMNSLVLFRNNLLDQSVCQGNDDSFSIEDDLQLFYNGNHIQIGYDVIPTEKISLNIFDVLGRLLNHETIISNQQMIDLSSFPTGIYFLVFEYNGKSVPNKIIIH